MKSGKDKEIIERFFPNGLPGPMTEETVDKILRGAEEDRAREYAKGRGCCNPRCGFCGGRRLWEEQR